MLGLSQSVVGEGKVGEYSGIRVLRLVDMEVILHLLAEVGDGHVVHVSVGMAEQLVPLSIHTGDLISRDGELGNAVLEIAVEQHGLGVRAVGVHSFLSVQPAHEHTGQHLIVALGGFIVHIPGLDAFHPVVLQVFAGEFREQLDVGARQRDQSLVLDHGDVHVDLIQAACGDVFDLVDALALQRGIGRIVQPQADLGTAPEVRKVRKAHAGIVVGHQHDAADGGILAQRLVQAVHPDHDVRMLVVDDRRGGFDGFGLAFDGAEIDRVAHRQGLVQRGLFVKQVPGIVRSLEQGVHARVGRGLLLAFQGHGDVHAAVVGDFDAAEIRQRGDILHVNREDDAGDITALRIHMVGTADQRPGAGLHQGCGGHCVQPRRNPRRECSS